MSNQHLEHMKNYFSQKTGLEQDQFGFYQKGVDGYTAVVVVVNNNRLIELGELSYVSFIRDKFNTASSARGAVEKFLDLCAEKLQNAEVNVPSLYGNKEMWADVYKETLPTYMRRDNLS